MSLFEIAPGTADSFLGIDSNPNPFFNWGPPTTTANDQASPSTGLFPINAPSQGTSNNAEPLRSTAPVGSSNPPAQPNIHVSDELSRLGSAQQNSENDEIDYSEDDWPPGENDTEHHEAEDAIEEECAQPDITNEEADTIKQEVDSGHPAQTMKADSKPDVSLTQLKVLDPRGDLVLVAGPGRFRFRVCSRSLARTSPVWEAMLYGPFAEGKDQQSDDPWTVALPEDYPDALGILLKAVHCQFNTLPTAMQPMQQDTLFQLTVLCDKYDMVELLKRFWHDWVLRMRVPDRDPKGFVHRLWIAHTLGHLYCYKIALMELLALCQKVEGKSGVFLEHYPEEDLCENIHLQALGIAEHLESARLALVRGVSRRLKQGVDNLADRKGQGPLCTSHGNPDWQHICDCTMLGALHRTLHSKAWYSAGTEGWEDRVTTSARLLIVEVEAVRSATIAESRIASRKGGHHHKNCTPWEPIKRADVLRSFKVEDLVPIDEKHFYGQQEKSGVHSYTHLPPAFFAVHSEYGL